MRQQLDYDDFTYEDGLLSIVSAGKWTPLSGFLDPNIVSGQITGGGGPYCAAVITTWAGSLTDHYARVTFIASWSVGVTLRSDAVDNLILIDFVFDEGAYVREVVNGSPTQLGDVIPFGTMPIRNDTFEAEIQGTTITVKHNGGVLDTRTATGVIASGKPGVIVGGDADDWRAGDFSHSDPELVVGLV